VIRRALAFVVLSTLVPSGLEASDAVVVKEARILALTGEMKPGPAKIGDLAWIAGNWRAEALGGMAEEIWSGPEAGTMMGMFRLIRNGRLAFYEILRLAEDGDSVTLRLKHFNADLTGWEEKDGFVEFRLVRLDGERAWFDGITFAREDPDTLLVWLAITGREGDVREEEFRFRRVEP
jgi:hypothetical protein